MDKKIIFPSSVRTSIFSVSKLTYLCLLVYIGLLLAFGDSMGLVPVYIGGIQFYGVDFIIILLLLTIITYGLKFLLNSRLSFLLTIAIAFGAINMVYAILNGHDVRDVIGAFRRLFFYMLAFQVTWKLLKAPERLTKVYSLIYPALFPIIIISLFRLLNAVSWNPIYGENDLRPVSLASVTILLWVFYDSVSGFVFTGKRGTVSQNLFWLILSGFTLFISNYRLLWITPLLGVGGLLWYSWQRRYIKIGKFLRVSFLVVTGIFISILLLKVTHNQFYGRIEQKFIEQIVGFQFVGSFRYYVWGEAWSRLQTNWLIGVGIGDRLAYLIRNSLGDWYINTSTTHNVFLEVLYQTGIIGSVSFILPHLFFVIYVLKHLRTLDPQQARPVLVLFITYVSMFITASFEPFFTYPNVVVLLYVIMGVVMRFIFWGKHIAIQELSREDRSI